MMLEEGLGSLAKRRSRVGGSPIKVRKIGILVSLFSYRRNCENILPSPKDYCHFDKESGCNGPVKVRLHRL